MSRKRGKQRKTTVEAVPADVLAEGSGAVRRVGDEAITTVEDVVTTDDIATTDDVITPDDIVATGSGEEPPPAALGDELADRPGEPSAPEAPELGNGRAASERESAGGDGADRVETAGAAERGIDGDLEPGVPADELDARDGDARAALPDDAEAGAPGDGDGLAEGDATGDDDDPAVVFPTSAATMDSVQLKHLVEALIFASDRPLTVQRLRQLTRVGDVRRLEQALAELAEDYSGRGVVLQQVSGGYQFRTRTQFSAWVQQLIAGRPVRLSRAQLETLAIIAYRQPITRPEIDDIRGVDSSATLKLLMDRMLIRVLGKREEVGRPMLYGTTKEFLDFFSLGDLRELPTLREYSELTAESRKVMSDRLGLPPDGPDGDGSAGGSGGDGDGGGPEGGGDGGGPPPGWGTDEGVPDDGASASGSADELADAASAFWAAAAAVERSEAAVAGGLDGEPGDDVSGIAERSCDETGETDETAETDEAGSDAAIGAVSGGAPSDRDSVPDEAWPGIRVADGAVPGDAAGSDEVVSWPAGSQRIAVAGEASDGESPQPVPLVGEAFAKIEEAPAGSPPGSPQFDAGTPDDGRGDAAPEPAGGEPAVE